MENVLSLENAIKSLVRSQVVLSDIAFSTVVLLINECAFNDECAWTAVRPFNQTKAFQRGFGVAQHLHGSTDHAAVNFCLDWWNPKISEHFARRH